MGEHNDSHSDTVSLTYQELATRLGIDLPSARRRVLRSRWQKTKGNDGKARVAVPVSVLPTVAAAVAPAALPTDATVLPTAAATALPAQSPAPPPVMMTEEALSRLLSHVGDVAELREKLARAETRAEHAETSRKAAEAERDALRAELTAWASGNPLTRAWRAFRYRRGQP